MKRAHIAMVCYFFKGYVIGKFLCDICFCPFNGYQMVFL